MEMSEDVRNELVGLKTLIPEKYLVVCCEGGGPEDLIGTLAISISKMADALPKPEPVPITEADWDSWYDTERELVAKRIFVRQIGLADRADGRPHSYNNLPEYVWYGPSSNRKVLRWYSEAYDGGYRGETGKPPEEFLKVEQVLASMPTEPFQPEIA